MSISPTFKEQLILTKVKQAAFLYQQFMFKQFWYKEIGRKAARKMLVNLTTEVKQLNKYFILKPI
jgi:hypothetical protein